MVYHKSQIQLPIQVIVILSSLLSLPLYKSQCVKTDNRLRYGMKYVKGTYKWC